MAMLLYRQATKLVPDIEWHYDFSNVGIQTEGILEELMFSNLFVLFTFPGVC